jgi:hypothetical protein
MAELSEQVLSAAFYSIPIEPSLLQHPAPDIAAFTVTRQFLSHWKLKAICSTVMVQIISQDKFFFWGGGGDAGSLPGL